MLFLYCFLEVLVLTIAVFFFGKLIANDIELKEKEFKEFWANPTLNGFPLPAWDDPNWHVSRDRKSIQNGNFAIQYWTHGPAVILIYDLDTQRFVKIGQKSIYSKAVEEAYNARVVNRLREVAQKQTNKKGEE